jgi:hypothetical protein
MSFPIAIHRKLADAWCSSYGSHCQKRVEVTVSQGGSIAIYYSCNLVTLLLTSLYAIIQYFYKLLLEDYRGYSHCHGPQQIGNSYQLRFPDHQTPSSPFCLCNYVSSRAVNVKFAVVIALKKEYLQSVLEGVANGVAINLYLTGRVYRDVFFPLPILQPMLRWLLESRGWESATIPNRD